MNNKRLRGCARRLGWDGVKRANTERKHDYGAKRVKSLLHEFLQNEDADTSRLDAHGSLSSGTKPGAGIEVSFLTPGDKKNGYFKRIKPVTAS